jgi:glycerol-3-phosphate acyltransferase PlsY
VFPVYIGFRGGKGVATGAGMLVTIAPLPIGFAALVFVSALLLTGYVSLGSLLGAITVPLSMVLLDRLTTFHYHPILLWLMITLALFVLFTHRRNISNLVRGQERSFPQLRLFRR